MCIGAGDPGRGNNVPKSQGVPGGIAVGPAMSDEKEQRGCLRPLEYIPKAVGNLH